MKKITLALTTLLWSITLLSAQNQGTVSGAVLNADGKPIEFANILLNSTADSSLVKADISDEQGLFEFPGVAAGTYFAQVSYVGLPLYNSVAFTVKPGEKTALPAFRLQAATNELKEVVVKAQKPLLEVKPDKMVFNVENSVSSVGSDGLELLRKSPGVMVDNNDNIMLQGKTGVRIYIDGKPSPLGASDLAAYLKTIQSSEVEAIEIITNPSSRYDAEGNAGIINIRLKKDKRLGANGNLDLGYSVGRLARYNGKISGNYRDKSVNLFGSYGYYEGRGLENFNLYREQSGLAFDQRNRMRNNDNGHSFRAGADFFLNDKNTIGVLANGSINDFTFASRSNTPISMIGNHPVDSILRAESLADGMRSNYNFNLNYRFDDKQGNVWNVDADYGLFRNRSEGYQPNYYLSPDGNEIYQEKIYENNTPTDIDIYTFKIDHERPILGGQFGAGIKLALVETDNTFDFYNVLNGEPQPDPDRSNRFNYSENVNAAYINYGHALSSKWNLQVGLRAEQTHSEGMLKAFKPTDDEEVKRTYLDFFPSGGLTYQLNPKNSFQFSYSRRIDRPSYQDLNPFENKLDELTFEKGNAFLNPQYSHNFQLTHTLNYRYNTTFSYSRATDLITRITDTSGDKASYITWLNLAKQDNFALSFSAPVQITKWWSSFTNLTGTYTHNKADFGDGKVVDLKAPFFNIYSQQTFSLPWDVKFELSGWYISPSVWGGTFEMNAMGNVDAGLQKKILNGKGSLKLAVSDIFYTNQWRGESRFGDLYMLVSGNSDSRRMKLNFTYLFGNDQVKSARRRNTGLEDEQKRIKSGNE
ncbi:MAG: TonB-dependent receptor [Lewinellaceae bacterium]|nr:TonB-dependent receptor [Lewinella sp.]MCB9281047.1 TonB-dependent receptor [Lewinellaceae bacterium]